MIYKKCMDRGWWIMLELPKRQSSAHQSAFRQMCHGLGLSLLHGSSSIHLTNSAYNNSCGRCKKTCGSRQVITSEEGPKIKQTFFTKATDFNSYYVWYIFYNKKKQRETSRVPLLPVSISPQVSSRLLFWIRNRWSFRFFTWDRDLTQWFSIVEKHGLEQIIPQFWALLLVVLHKRVVLSSNYV